MKKRYFYALLLLFVAAWLLPQSMRADQLFVKLAVADNAASFSASSSLSLTFCYGTKGTDTATELYFDLTDKANGYPSWLGFKEGGNIRTSSDYTYAPKVTTAKLTSDFTTHFEGTTCASWFQGCFTMTGIENIEKLNTSNVTNMTNMFLCCHVLTPLTFYYTDTNNTETWWDTSNVTNMTSMFDQCWNLTTLDLSGWDTSNVTSMSCLFSNCTSLSSLTFGKNWDTSKVTSMSYMFSHTAFTTLDLSCFDTSKVTNMSYMFNNCSSLEGITVDIQKWNTDAVTTSTGMFLNCTKLPDYNASITDVKYAQISTGSNSGLLTLKTPVEAFTYYDDQNMTEKLAQLNGATITSLTLGRTFPTETYGTVCLPIALDAAQVTSVFGTGTIVKSLTGATYDSNNNRLTLTFTDVTSSGMTAGVPYLIKSAQATPATLSDVTISPSVAVNDPDVVNGLCQMHGVLNPSEPGASPNYLFVSGGQLYYSEGGTLNGMRAYFELHGDAATAANNSAGARPRVSFDGDPSETGILSIDANGNLTYEETGDWYTLGGVKLSGKPTTKGMYIQNGKKYIVK